MPSKEAPSSSLSPRNPDVAAAVEAGRLETLAALVDTLTEAISLVADAQVPPLAARLVDVLRRIGGSDPSVLIALRGSLAVAVDRIAKLQGEFSDTGKPLGTELAPTVRQLVAVVEALESMPKAGKVSKRDDLAERRARRRAEAAAVPVASSGGGKRR